MQYPTTHLRRMIVESAKRELGQAVARLLSSGGIILLALSVVYAVVLGFQQITVALGAAGAVALSLSREFRDRSEAAHSARIEALERPEPARAAELTLMAFAADQLYAAAERERLAIKRGERRLTWLYQIGTLLAVLSVLVPFVLVYLYIKSDPVRRLQALGGLRVDPTLLAEAAQRDWHLLVAGVSFGLLFLAAARGILNSELRQRDAYRAAAEREGYYGDLARALRIADKLAEDPNEYPDKVRGLAVRRVLDRLLEGSPRERQAAPTNTSSATEAPDAGFLPEHTKALVALFSRPR